jgi:hypothetical protein
MGSPSAMLSTSGSTAAPDTVSMCARAAPAAGARRARPLPRSRSSVPAGFASHARCEAPEVAALLEAPPGAPAPRSRWQGAPRVPAPSRAAATMEVRRRRLALLLQPLLLHTLLFPASCKLLIELRLAVLKLLRGLKAGPRVGRETDSGRGSASGSRWAEAPACDVFSIL